VTGEITKRLEELTARLRKTFGDDLRMAVLYGSGATGEVHAKFSDLNVLCVLRRVSAKELRAAEGLFAWWHSLDNPAPLLLSEEEFHNATDAFPIEFHDIADCHRVLAGEDLMGNRRIDDRYYRGQVEHELRSKLLRLRQKSAGVFGDKSTLLRLLADSVSTFGNLSRHVLRLHGLEAPMVKREAIAACAVHFGIQGEPFYTLLDLRSGSVSARQLDPHTLLDEYLLQIEALTSAVDRLSKRGEL